VLNGPSAIDSDDNEIEILDSTGATLGSFQGPKSLVARSIFTIIHRELMIPRLAEAQKPI